MTLDRESYFFTARYTRGQVCKVLGITKDTLRHYENCGIITPEECERNRYKYYSIADLEVLNVILFLRAIDVPISDIPRFIECKDVDTYEDLLSNQIDKVTMKINHWCYVKKLLIYFKDTLQDYQNNPHHVSLVKDITFRIRIAKFDYKNYDIEQMTPSRISNIPMYHITKLKIVGKKWLLSNREETSDMIIGHLCAEGEKDEVHVCTLKKALTVTTLDNIDKLPEMIMNLWKEYEDIYEFDEKVYFIEHAFFNIFNQGALLRNIYLPIVSIK